MEKLHLIDLPPNRFENAMMQEINVEDINQHNEGLMTLLEVYVDNFIALSNDIRHTHLMSLSRATLHGIHVIFPPPEVTGHNVFDPISLKKMQYCDGIWDHHKEILGWDFYGINYNIQLPAKKNSDICTLTQKIQKNLEWPSPSIRNSQ